MAVPASNSPRSARYIDRTSSSLLQHLSPKHAHSVRNSSVICFTNLEHPHRTCPGALAKRRKPPSYDRLHHTPPCMSRDRDTAEERHHGNRDSVVSRTVTQCDIDQPRSVAESPDDSLERLWLERRRIRRRRPILGSGSGVAEHRVARL